jgi:regulator of RNase E activity RraA
VRVPAELPEVRILRLEPGDVLLITCPQRVDDAMYGEITERMAVMFPGHRCALLDGGLGLDIMRAEGGE